MKPVWWRMMIGLDDDRPPPEPIRYNMLRTRVVYDGWPCGRDEQLIRSETLSRAHHGRAM